MESSNKHVLITGAGGFIGGHIVEIFLHHGWRVTALVHKNVPESLRHERISIIQADLTEVGSVSMGECKPDIVVHVAGLASDLGSDVLHRKLNFESTVQCATLTEAKFIYIYSMDVYGIRDFHGEDEDTLPYESHCLSPYPKYKIKSEQWLRRNMETGKYVILRPGAVYGRGDKTIEPRMVSFLASSPWIIHFGKWKGQNRWPAANVENLAQVAYMCAVTQNFDGQAINIIDAEHTTIDAYYRKIAASYFPNRVFRSVTLPFWMGRAIGRLSTFLATLLGRTHALFDPTSYALRHISSDLNVSSAKQERALAIYREKISIRP